MTTEDTIKVSKTNRVYVAECDYFGRIEDNLYKSYEVTVGNCTYVGSTFATNFAAAVSRLHEWIKDNNWVVTNYPKSKITIYCVDGSVDKHKELAYIPVYSITMAKAKKYLL